MTSLLALTASRPTRFWKEPRLARRVAAQVAGRLDATSAPAPGEGEK